MLPGRWSNSHDNRDNFLSTLRTTAPDSQVAQYNVFRIDVQRVIGQTDPIAGCGLTGNSDIGVVNVDVGFQLNDARYSKDQDARSLGLDGRSEAAWTAVIEIGNLNNATAPASAGEHPAAPGTWKGRNAFRQSWG